MADTSPKGNTGRPGSQDENDPILQGADRVQPKEEIDSHLASENQEATEDTHTRSNIHLGGRNAEGKGTGPEEDETNVAPLGSEFENLSPRNYPVPDGGPIEPSGEGFVPVVPPLPEDPVFQSSGRATPEVEIEESTDGRPTIDPYAAFSGQRATTITPLSEDPLALLGEDEEETGPPVTSPVDLGATDEDTSTTFSDDDLLANATDPDNDDLTVGNVAIAPEFGVIIDNGDGTYTFEPAPDYNGDDLPITYTISDGTTTIPGDAIIDVLPVNDPPTSDDAETVIDEDTSYTFSLSDFVFEDIEGDEFDHVTITELPANGTLFFDGVEVDAGDEIPASELGLLIFTPAENDNGEDYATFIFTVNDGTDDSEPYTFSIDVTPVNDAPTSADDGTVIEEDSSYTFVTDDFLFEDIDGDSFDHLTITSLPLEGTLTFDGVAVNVGDPILPSEIGLLVFTPDENDNGEDYATFKFTVNDGTVDSDPYTFSIDVTPVNDVPTLDDNETTILEDNSHTFELSDFTENYDDVEGDSAAFVTITSLPLDGALTIGGAAVVLGDNNKIAVADLGDLVFTPAENENGDDYAAFNFTVEDDGADPATSAQHSFTIDVTPVNDAPVVDDNEATILEDNSHTFQLSDFTENYDDVEGDSAAFVTITSLPVDGTLTIDGAAVVLGDNNKIAVADIGDLVFTPLENASGDDYASFNFTVEDDNASPATSAEHSFTIDVTAVADDPNLCVLTEKVDGSALYDITQGGIVTVNVEYFAVDAGFENSHGYYIADSDGNPIGGKVVKDNVKELGIEEISFDTADYPGGVTLGFFIIPDGDTQNPLLESDDAVTFQNVGGTWTPFVGGVALVGAQAAPAYFSDMALNPDGVNHFDDTGIDGNQNWEDLWNGGDNDNTDVNAFVTLRICDDEATVQGYEETPIALPAITGMLTDLDGSEELTMTISNIPDGVELKDGSGNSFTASAGDNSVDLLGWDLHSLEVIAPVGTDDFVLDVEAKSTEMSNNDTATTNGTITVDILHVPTTSPVDLGATPEDTSVDFTAAKLLENAGDVDGDILTISNVAIDPIYGTITDNGGGSYTFNPADDYNGDDLPISYDISDGENTISGSAIIDVTPVNDVPTLDDNEATILEDNTHTFQLSDFTENYDDVEGDSAAFVTITSLPLDGALTIGGAAVVLGDNNKIAVADLGDLVFTPAENENGDDYAAFNFTVEDDGADPATSAQHSFTIDVTPEADAPTITMSVGEVVNNYETGPLVINTGNVLDTDNGYSVTARIVNNDGTLSEATAGNVFVGAGQIGVGGTNDGPDDQLGFVEGDGQSEELILSLDQSIASIDVSISLLYEDDDGATEDEIGYYRLYEEGVEVGSGTFLGVAGGIEHTLSINPGGDVVFDQIIFSTDQDLTSGLEGHSDYFINSLTIEEYQSEVVSSYTYPVTIVAALTDMDGSEDLSDIIVSGVPEDVLFLDGDNNPVGVDNNDGTWTFTQAELTGLQMNVPLGQEGFELTASVISTETSNSDAESSSSAIVPVEEVVNHDLAPDIPEGINVIVDDDSGGTTNGTAAADYIDGAGGNDTIKGKNGEDILFGGAGNDTLKGQNNDDQLFGGSGNDRLEGGNQNDELYGGTGADVLVGGKGNDILVGGAGNDTLNGNRGHDSFIFSSNEGDDTVQGGSGASWVDTIELSGFSGLDHEVGWTLVLDGGSIIQSTDDAAGEMILSQDADGTITFDDGGSITFENIEKISW